MSTLDIYYLRDMAKMSGSGNAYLNLAEAYLHQNEWGMAVIAITEALKSSSLDSRGRAFKVLADAYSRQGKKILSGIAMEKSLAEAA